MCRFIPALQYLICKPPIYVCQRAYSAINLISPDHLPGVRTSSPTRSPEERDSIYFII